MLRYSSRIAKIVAAKGETYFYSSSNVIRCNILTNKDTDVCKVSVYNMHNPSYSKFISDEFDSSESASEWILKTFDHGKYNEWI